MSRNNYGAMHHNARLSDAQVGLIRAEYAQHSRRCDGYSCRDIAMRYDSNERTVYDIVDYRTRRSAPG